MKKEKLHSFWFYCAQDAAVVLNWIGVRFAWFPKLHYAKGVKKSRIIRKKAIIVCNHSSFADPPCVCAQFPFRRVYTVTAKELFKKPFEKPLEMMGCIKIDRDHTDYSSIRECIRHLKANKLLTIFPEGKINLYDELADFKSGAVLLSALTGAPIIPLYNAGNYKRFQRVQLIMGEPISAEEITNGPVTKERIDEVTEKLKKRIEALRDELYTRMSDKHKLAAKQCREDKLAKLALREQSSNQEVPDEQA